MSTARAISTTVVSAFVLLGLAAAAAGPAAAQTGACPKDRVAGFVKELSDMSASAEESIRYLIPKFRQCGQAVIAGELQGSPEWLAAMRQHLQAQQDQAGELKTAIDTALGNLSSAEASLQKNYELVLKGIDAMYDNKFPPACRNERTKIVSNMKSVRPMVPAAIGKLNTFKGCLGV